MIEASVKNKIKFIVSVAILFLVCLLLKVDLSVAILLSTLFIYLKFSLKNEYSKTYSLLNLNFLFTVIFFISYFMIKSGVSSLWIPFCIIPMLSTILFNELRVSLLLSVAASFTIASISGNNFYLGLGFLISGIFSSILVFGARKRSVIIRAGVVTGIIQAMTLFIMQDFQLVHPQSYLILLANGIICSIIVLGSLPVFEYLFKTVTNISLLELTDSSHPLLQRMVMEAAGTYNHSLVVGNLSDAACQAVGANGLLARIGSYYHDIGKLSKPEYFSENQILVEDSKKHDTLKPTMSKLVIMNHVKEGVDLAKKYKLNPRIIEFIQEHHGNSLVYYFYRKALENLEEKEELNQEGFRYPGPKPKSKESAICLLADSVEAASRALKDPNPNSIEELVHKVINNKFIDGQLDECDLTLRDLEKIAAVFKRILSGIYHSRITYPDTKDDISKD